MKKILYISLLFLGFGLTISFAQSDKMKEKAMEKVEELNAEIMAGDKSQVLTEIQKDIIMEIHIKRMKALRAIKKGDNDEADRKEVNKKYFQQINKEVLTDKQRKAKRAGKDKMED